MGKGPEGRQRYKCKSCGSTFRLGNMCLRVIKMYLDGLGIKSIERLEAVSNLLIIYWIRHFSELIRKEIKTTYVPNKLEDIEILEVDELFIKKSEFIPFILQ